MPLCPSAIRYGKFWRRFPPSSRPPSCSTRLKAIHTKRSPTSKTAASPPSGAAWRGREGHSGTSTRQRRPFTRPKRQMGMVHVSAEELSALLDGELSPQEELRARQHLTVCESCSAEYALSVRLDDELRQPPVLACDAILPVLSAGLDREVAADEQAAAQRHLAECVDCRASVEVWSSVGAGIKALPVIPPSARVDDAIYAIARGRRTYRPAPVRGIAARALIAVTAVIAVIVASLGSGGGPAPIAVLPNPTGERAIAASAQQIDVNSRNNTIYVLDIP